MPYLRQSCRLPIFPLLKFTSFFSYLQKKIRHAILKWSFLCNYCERKFPRNWTQSNSFAIVMSPRSLESVDLPISYRTCQPNFLGPDIITTASSALHQGKTFCKELKDGSEQNSRADRSSQQFLYYNRNCAFKIKDLHKLWFFLCQCQDIAFVTKSGIFWISNKTKNVRFLGLHTRAKKKYQFIRKFTFWKSHISQNSQFPSPIFHKNSHFQNLIFHKIHIFQTSNSW